MDSVNAMTQTKEELEQMKKAGIRILGDIFKETLTCKIIERKLKELEK